MYTIKPSFPSTGLFIVTGCLVCIGMEVFGPRQDLDVLILMCFFIAFIITILWATDCGFMYISYDDDKIIFRGFLGIRRVEYKYEEIEGYQIHQKADQINGFHEEIQVLIPGKKNLIIPRFGYSEQKYNEVQIFVQKRLKFKGRKYLRNGAIIGKAVTIMFALSGSLMVLVALAKYIK